MVWRYTTSVGTFYIRAGRGDTWLFLGRDRLNTYPSPQTAADHVAIHAVGHSQWDWIEESVPWDLGKWDRLR